MVWQAGGHWDWVFQGTAVIRQEDQVLQEMHGELRAWISLDCSNVSHCVELSPLDTPKERISLLFPHILGGSSMFLIVLLMGFSHMLTTRMGGKWVEE